jgi:hypothetical protein
VEERTVEARERTEGAECFDTALETECEVDVDVVERIDDVLFVTIRDSVGRPLWDKLSEGVGVGVFVPSSLSSSSRAPFPLSPRGDVPSPAPERLFVVSVLVIFIEGLFLCALPCARAFSVASLRTLVTLAESGVSFESGRASDRDVVLWFLARPEPEGVSVRAILLIDAPELVSSRPWPCFDEADAGTDRESTDARRE